MITCENCGKQYASDVTPLHCRCGTTTAKRVEKKNAWHVLHSRYAAAIESREWSETVERHWLDTEFARLAPCASCGKKWLSLSTTIDLSTAESAFQSAWAAHNTVSTEHVQPPKPTITFEQCKALYLQQPSMDDCCIAVTSLAHDRLDRQTECLNSWKRAGLTIFAVQTASEVGELREQYPQVSTWSINSHTGRQPTINRMASIAPTIQIPILIINSDIEIHGEQRLIRDAIARGTLIGIRHNYNSNWWVNTRELWGVDVFSIRPSDILPQLPLRIGSPCWDYWLLHNFRRTQSWISEPLFFHRVHRLNWSKADWDSCSKVFVDHYQLKDFDSMQFRRQFPFSG